MSEGRTVAVTPLACAVVLTAQMATTIYLPSLPKIAADLGIADSVVKWSVTLFVISAALPVVVWGRLADRLGRRTALLSSLALFVIACVALALVQSAAVLLIGRIVQGIGAGGAAIVVRMMVKDRFTGSELASRLSLLSMAFVVALGGGQLIGGALASFTSWRAGFGVLGAFGVALAAVAVNTENTTVRDNNERVVRWNAIVLTPKFYKPAIAGGLGFGAIVLVQQSSPFLFSDRFNLQPWAFGAFGILYGAAYFGGALYVNRRATAVGSEKLMRRGALCMLVAGLVLMLCWYPPLGSIPLLVVFLIGYVALTFGQSLLFPNSAASAVTHFAEGGAIAVAYCGLVQQGIAGIASVVGPLASDERVWSAIIALITAAATALVFSLRTASSEPTVGTSHARH